MRKERVRESAQRENQCQTIRRGGWRILVITVLFLFVQGCAPKVQVTYVPQAHRSRIGNTTSVNSESLLLLKHHYEKWRGTPYVPGGMSASGIDCSGFTLLAYRDLFGVSLPRTTAEQAVSGREVARAALKSGDLVFFNTGRFKKHVGIYLGDDQFIHASLTKGVTLSSLEDNYWQEKYWQARRMQEPMGQGIASSSVLAAYR